MKTRMVRIFLCLIILGQCCILNAQKRSNLHFSQVTLQEVLTQLEEKFNVVFSYTSDNIEDVFVNHPVSGNTIEDVLTALLNETAMTFEVHSEQFIVIKKRPSSLVDLCATIVNSDNEPLSFVNVYIPLHKVGTSSNEEGSLKWATELMGHERIEFTYIGYEKVISSVEALKSCPVIVLQEKEFSFEEVVVKEYVTSGIEQSEELDHMVMRPDKINMVPGLTDADVLQMVQLLPGVQSIDESATGLYVRGGTPDQNLILYDGIPIYNGGHFFGMLSAFNPSLVDKVNVYRSGFGPDYGGRVSSVIDIRSIDRVPENVSIDAGINFMHGDVSVALPVWSQRLGLVLGARKSYTDIVETPTYRKLSERVFRTGKFEEVLDEDDPEIFEYGLAFDFNDYNAKLIAQPSKKDKVSFSYFHIDDNLNFDFFDVEDDFSTNDILIQNSNGWGLEWDRRWSDSFESRLNVSKTKQTNNYQFSFVDQEQNTLESVERQFNDINDFTIVWNNQLRLGKNFDLTFGCQYADLQVERSWQFEDEEENNEVDQNQIATGFVSFNSFLFDKLKTKVGLRYNYARATEEQYFEPRVSMRYLMTRDVQFKMMAGYYRQFMSQVIEFNDLGINQDFWVLSDDDENIPVVLSKNLTFGVIYHKGPMMFEVDGYYKKRDGLTSNLSTFRSDIEADFEEGSGSSWGVDVLLKRRWGNFQSWLTYSYARTDYTVFIEEEDYNFRAPHDRPHSFSFVNQWNSKRWNLSLKWSMASGIVYTEAIGLIEEDDFADPEYDLGGINDSRLPSSHRLDFSMMYRLFNKNGYTGRFGLSLLNLYNNDNLMSREFFTFKNEDNDEFELEERDRAMLRFTPNLVFRVSFN